MDTFPGVLFHLVGHQMFGDRIGLHVILWTRILEIHFFIHSDDGDSFTA